MKKLFNLKRLLKKRNNGGFTLIEVIISVALLGILVTGVTIFAAPVMNMVKVNQKNARATMLAEAIDVYISGCMRNAKMVAVVTNTTLDAAKAGITHNTINDFVKFMKEKNPSTNNFNYDDYEVRCIAIHWDTDSISGRKKLILSNCIVNNNFSDPNNKLNIQGDPRKIFDDSLYLNLFPVITLENFETQDNTGTETGDLANGYKVVTSIHANLECYNAINDYNREKGSVSFIGTTYVECANMVEYKYDPSGKPIKEIIPAPEIASMAADVQTAINNGRSGREYTEGGTAYYYPDTFIYYAVSRP